MNKQCPNCPIPQELEIGEYFDYCRFCGYEIDKRWQIPLWVPSPFDSKEYDLKTVDEIHGYIVYFKEGEPKMSYKEPHVHIRGQGREIQYFLSPLRVKKKIPKNFPEREESKIYKTVKEKWLEYLDKWNEAKNK